VIYLGEFCGSAKFRQKKAAVAAESALYFIIILSLIIIITVRSLSVVGSNQCLTAKYSTQSILMRQVIDFILLYKHILINKPLV